MELKNMTFDELEARKTELADSVEVEGADLDAIESELRSINEEVEARKAEEAKREEIRSMVASGNGTVIEERKVEERKMERTAAEIRASQEYVDAYVNYLKTKDDSECRSLLTTDGNGTVAVPTLVYDLVKTAWEKEGIVSRVRKAYLKGDLKVNFEISAGAANKQTEGQAVNEESLVLGTVTLINNMYIKWISISKQAMSLRGEAFLQFVIDEIVQKIAKKLADEVVTAIVSCPQTATTTAVSVPVVSSTTVTVDLVAQALAQLSDEAANPTIIMNRATWGEVKKAQYANKYGIDPFEGLDVVFNNSMKSFTTATSGDTYMIVGDLDHGALINFPNDGEIETTIDELSLATSGMVKVIGSAYAGIGIVAPKAFVKVQK